MKKLAIIALALISTSALSFEYSMPVKFGSTSVQLHSTCVNADGDLQTTFPVKKYEYVGPRDKKVLVSEEYLTTSATYFASTCVEYSRKGACIEREVTEKTYPLNGTIRIYDWVRVNKEHDKKVLIGTRPFTVPSC